MARPMKDLVITMTDPGAKCPFVSFNASGNGDTIVVTIEARASAGVASLTVTPSGGISPTITTSGSSGDTTRTCTCTIDNRDVGGAGNGTLTLGVSAEASSETDLGPGTRIYCSSVSLGNAYLLGGANGTLAGFATGSTQEGGEFRTYVTATGSAAGGSNSGVASMSRPSGATAPSDTAGTRSFSCSFLVETWTGNTGDPPSVLGPIAFSWSATFSPGYRVRTGTIFPSVSAGMQADECLKNCSVSYSGHAYSGTDSNHIPYYFYYGGTPCTVTVTPVANASIVQVVTWPTFSPGMPSSGSPTILSGSNGAYTFVGTEDVDVCALCAFSRCLLSFDVYTNGSEDSTGGSVTRSPSPSNGYAVGDAATLTAVPAAGYMAGYKYWHYPEEAGADPVRVREMWQAAVSSSIGLGFGDSNESQDNPASYTFRPDSFGSGEYSLVHVFPSANLSTWFLTRTRTIMVHFSTAKWELRFNWKTYGAHGAALLGTGDTYADAMHSFQWVDSGDEIATTSSNKILIIGALKNWPDRDPGFFYYGIVRCAVPNSTNTTRRVLYAYPQHMGDGEYDNATLLIPPADQVGGNVVEYDVWIWPRTTGKVLCSADGTILCGAEDLPMAQYVEAYTQGNNA